MPRAVYHQKGALRTLPRRAKERAPRRNTHSTTVPTPSPKPNGKRKLKSIAGRSESVRPQTAKAGKSPVGSGPKVVWSNDRVRKTSRASASAAASSELPHPFAAFDAEEVDLSIPSFQMQPPLSATVEERDTERVEKSIEEGIEKVDSVAVEPNGDETDVVEDTGKEQESMPSSTVQHHEALEEVEAGGEKRGDVDDETKSWTEKAQSILDAYRDEGQSVVSPLSSWYFLGGAPDFRPAASRRRKRKRNVPLFQDPTVNEEQVKRVKSENRQVLGSFEKELKEARKEEQAFTKSLLEKLGGGQVVPPG